MRPLGLLLFATLLMAFSITSAAQELVFRPSIQTGSSCPSENLCYTTISFVGNLQPVTLAVSQTLRYPGLCDMGAPSFDPAKCASSPLMSDAKNSFFVYTVDQVDGRVLTLTQRISTLEADIKKLSDTNDALSARLSSIEAKVMPPDNHK